jgi:hypothetical protein
MLGTGGQSQQIPAGLNPALQVPGTDFELSVRGRNRRREADIPTLGDLTHVSELQSKIFRAVVQLVPPGPDMVTMGKLPQTPRVKRVLEYALEEARSLRHDYVGTEHLLLALLRVPDSTAVQILLSLGLKLEEIRKEVLRLLGQNVDPAASALPPQEVQGSVPPAATGFGYERFTEAARRVMQLAHQEAQRLNHEYISTEHLLLGLLKEGTGIAAAVLNQLERGSTGQPAESKDTKACQQPELREAFWK